MISVDLSEKDITLFMSFSPGIEAPRMTSEQQQQRCPPPLLGYGAGSTVGGRVLGLGVGGHPRRLLMSAPSAVVTGGTP